MRNTGRSGSGKYGEAFEEPLEEELDDELEDELEEQLDEEHQHELLDDEHEEELDAKLGNLDKRSRGSHFELEEEESVADVLGDHEATCWVRVSNSANNPDGTGAVIHT